MKKIYLFLLAAAGILAVASCAREEFIDNSGDVNATEEVTTLTFSFGAVKTALVEGKTTWAAGDKIRVYTSDAGFYRDVEVPEDAIGKASFSAEVNIKDTLYYAVYPIEACKSISGGKVNVVLPTNPDGRFASANICVAATKGSEFQFKNVTAVLKINVNSGNVVEMLQVSASKENETGIVGNLAVSFEGDTLNFAVTSPSKSATIAVGGVDGDYFIPVLPGKYKTGFSVTALRANGGYQTLKTTSDNVVKVNTLLNLGTIGNNLSDGLSGKGTEAEPFVISNLGEWTAFQASVNLGKSYAGEYVSLETDVTEAVAKPVGYYLSSDVQYPFSGIFKGNNHTVLLDIDGKNLDSEDEVGLFGYVGAGASITDLTVEGTVTSTGIDVGGVVGWACGANGKTITLKNLTNKAKISTSSSCAGGVVAYAYFTDILNCNNQETVTSTATAGTGMFFPAGNNYSASDYNCGVGGVAGWAQNCTIKDATNSAAITGYTKVGGIAGTTYWTGVDNAHNTADITANGYYEGNNISGQMQMGLGSATGGVIGWVHTSGAIKNCSNSGKVVGKLGIGGVIGLANSNQSATPSFTNLTNSGTVTSNTEGTGKTFPRGIGGHNPGTGGIIGSLVRFGPKVQVYVTNCKNLKSGTVYSPSVNTGGIVGLVHDHGNTSKPMYSYVKECVNEADVTGGPYWVGGIVGYSFARYGGRLEIRNCANHGKVTGTRASGNGTVAGGILGGFGSNGAAGTYQPIDMIHLYNNYNDGEVVYSSLSLTVPYVGGIIGNSWGTAYIQNNYNIGYVGPSDKSEPVAAALKYLGGLAGYQKYSSVHYSYSANNVLGGQIVGTAGTANRTDTVCSFDPADGTLAINVTANNVICDKLIDALNGWQDYYKGDGTVHFNWTGPANHPVFDTTMN
ncbi:MAG: hypothetical protein IJL22_04220 [Bacteroidales bacterium]|nr:hypothetical protein [Bacteroidales bacterium]